MKYRAELDGLRALAVIPVIIFHLGFSVLSGGFIGVDVFFVISGYLITTIINDEMVNGRFTIINFYQRRVKRILPALVITILITAALSPILLIPSQIKDVAQSVVATSLFLSNYFFYLETDYFNQFTNHAPLLHTWSLAVEEQFYILFPLLLYILRDKISLKLFTILAVLTLSLIFSVFTLEEDKNLAFYALHTRAWELMIGAAFALLTPKIDNYFSSISPTKKIVLELVSLASLASILLPYFLFDSNTPHPGIYTAWPVLGTAILIVITRYGSIVKQILSTKILVNIGLISYGLYLYHHPVFSFIDIYYDGIYSNLWLLKLLSIPVILAIAYLSYRFVEKPVRKTNSLHWKNVFTIALSVNLCLLCIGYYVHHMNGFQEHFASVFADNGGILLIDVDAEKQRIAEIRKRVYPSDDEYNCKIGCKKVIILGDSFADDAYLSLASKHVDTYEIRRLYLDDPCMRDAVNAIMLNQSFMCNKKKVKLSLIDDADLVIITAKWQEHTYTYGYELASFLSQRFDQIVYVVGSIMFTDLSSMSLKLARNKITTEKSAGLMFNYQRWDRTIISNKLKDLVLQNTNLHWIEKRDFFCDTQGNKCQLFDSSGLPKIWDNAHLTTRTYREYANFLMSFISG